MIGFLLVALLQAAAGSPAPAPATAAEEMSAGPGAVEGAAGEAAAPAADPAPAVETAPAAEPAPDAPVQYRRERRCREVEVTGRRMPQRVCSNVMVPVTEPAAEAAPAQ